MIGLDIRGLFDNIDHELLMKAVRPHIKEPWQVPHIGRWLKAPFVDRNCRLTPGAAGTPRGGVVNPVAANLFMRHAFDRWMGSHHPDVPFERYADYSEVQANPNDAPGRGAARACPERGSA